MSTWRGGREDPTQEFGEVQTLADTKGRTEQCKEVSVRCGDFQGVGLPRYIRNRSLFEGRAEICFRAVFTL